MNKLGVELEVTGVTRESVAVMLSYLFGNVITFEVVDADIPFKRYTIKDKLGNAWTVTRDRSIGQEYHKLYERYTTMDTEIVKPSTGYNYAVEIVSPVLNADTLRILFDVVTALRSHGAIVNDTCGFHVHVDAMDIKSCINLYNRWLDQQDSLYNRLDIPVYRMTSYCKRFDTSKYMPDTISDVKSLIDWLVTTYENGNERRSIRYYGLNFYALEDNGTIEFRVFSASLDNTDLASYIKFVLDFCYQGYDDSYAPTIEYILLEKIMQAN